MYGAISLRVKGKSKDWEQQEEPTRARESEMCFRRASVGCQRLCEISCWSKPDSLLLSLSISPLNSSSHLFWQYYQIPASAGLRSKSNILYNLLMARVRKLLMSRHPNTHFWHPRIFTFIKYSQHRAPKPMCTYVQYTVYWYLNIYVEEISQSIWCNCESGPMFLKCRKLRVVFFCLCIKRATHLMLITALRWFHHL